MKYQIAHRTFKTKAQIKQAVRDVVAQYGTGETLAGDDDAFIRALFQRHPEADRKIGCGIDHIKVVQCPVYGKNKMFELHRTDGSYTDISWKVCVEGKPPKSDAQDALRNAVDYQISAFRTEAFKGDPRCRLTGEPLGPGNSHVDHAPPNTFQRLMDNFLTMKGITADQVPVTPPADNQTRTYLTDEVFEREWCDFHQRHAKLRLLSARDNLSNARAEARAASAPSLAETLS